MTTDPLPPNGNEPSTDLPKEKSKRLVLFSDLRDSTEIMCNYERGVYQPGEDEGISTYAEFLLDCHKTAFEHLNLDHTSTYTEIYGDGFMAIFPEDNDKYLLENIYDLTTRMRSYNDTGGVGTCKPAIDIGFGITVGDVSFIYYNLDKRLHPVGPSIHQAARIESLSRYYDARVLISEKFLYEAEYHIDIDPRFHYRFIDKVRLKGFREPVSLYELLIDNDPRYENKMQSIPFFTKGYEKYCEQKWLPAKELFQYVYTEFGLGIGLVMAKRCDLLYQTPPTQEEWDGVWKMKNK